MTTCPNKPILQGIDLSQSFQGQPVIAGINVELYPGETVCILGKSGVGKTTLFNILSGLERPETGQVLLNGKDITGQSGKVAYMQQKDLLLPFRTVADNAAVPLRLQGVGKKEARRRVEALLPEFDLAGTAKKYPAQLSGGMRQRAALLRSYLFNDQIMLMDEPFSALDALTKNEMHRWFRHLALNRGTASFMVTHDIDEGLKLADRIYIMTGDGKAGRIRQEIRIDYDGERDEAFTISPAYVGWKKQILAALHPKKEEDAATAGTAE